MANREVSIKIKVDIDNENVKKITNEMIEEIFIDMNGRFNVGDFEVETDFYGIIEEDEEEDE